MEQYQNNSSTRLGAKGSLSLQPSPGLSSLQHSAQFLSGQKRENDGVVGLEQSAIRRDKVQGQLEGKDEYWPSPGPVLPPANRLRHEAQPAAIGAAHGAAVGNAGGQSTLTASAASPAAAAKTRSPLQAPQGQQQFRDSVSAAQQAPQEHCQYVVPGLLSLQAGTKTVVVDSSGDLGSKLGPPPLSDLLRMLPLQDVGRYLWSRLTVEDQAAMRCTCRIMQQLAEQGLVKRIDVHYDNCYKLAINRTAKPNPTTDDPDGDAGDQQQAINRLGWLSRCLMRLHWCAQRCKGLKSVVAPCPHDAATFSLLRVALREATHLEELALECSFPQGGCCGAA